MKYKNDYVARLVPKQRTVHSVDGSPIIESSNINDYRCKLVIGENLNIQLKKKPNIFHKFMWKILLGWEVQEL